MQAVAASSDRVTGDNRNVVFERARWASRLTRPQLVKRVNELLAEQNANDEVDLMYVGKLERREISRPSESRRRAFCEALSIPDEDKLFPPRGAQTGEPHPIDCPARAVGDTVEDVNRRRLLQSAVGVSALGILPAPATPRRITTVSRDQIRQILDDDTHFDQEHHQKGSRLSSRRALHDQLCDHETLLDVHCPTSLRVEFFSAMCQLTHTAAFMAWDARNDAYALACYTQARLYAEEIDDWHLRASILANRASLHLWRNDRKNTDSAITAIQEAFVRADKLTATGRARLHNCHARILAATGDVQATLRAVGQAEEEFAESNPADDPSHIRWYTTAEHASEIGEALASLRYTPSTTEQTIQQLQTAINNYGDRHPRSQALARLRLGTVLLRTDPHHAARVAGAAISSLENNRIHSVRLAELLAAFSDAARPFTDIDAIAELRRRVSTTTVPRPK